MMPLCTHVRSHDWLMFMREANKSATATFKVAKPLGKDVFFIVINKILPPGYMQTEEMFNL